MTLSREQLEAEARQLSRLDRARLAQALIASLGPDPEVEAAWLEEVRRRHAEIQSGEVTLIPAEEAFEQVRRKLESSSVVSPSDAVEGST